MNVGFESLNIVSMFKGQHPYFSHATCILQYRPTRKLPRDNYICRTGTDMFVSVKSDRKSTSKTVTRGTEINKMQLYFIIILMRI